MQARLVDAPPGVLVEIPELREYLELDSSYRDAVIADLQAAAIADLQKQTGRCILPQTWAIDLPGAGTWPLPFPDVSAVEAGTGTASLGWCGQRQTVTVTEAATVQFTAGLSEALLPIARLVVKQMVAHWFLHREAVSEGALSAMPMGADDLVARLRWRML